VVSLKKEGNTQNYHKTDKPRIHDFTVPSIKKSSAFAGWLIISFLTIAGAYLLFYSRQLGLSFFGVFTAVLFFGVGVFAFVSTIVYKLFIRPKEVVAQLVSINDAKSFAQCILKFQDTNEKVYTFYKIDINFEDISVSHVYRITVQGSRVLDVGDLISTTPIYHGNV